MFMLYNIPILQGNGLSTEDQNSLKAILRLGVLKISTFKSMAGCGHNWHDERINASEMFIFGKEGIFRTLFIFGYAIFLLQGY